MNCPDHYRAARGLLRKLSPATSPTLKRYGAYKLARLHVVLAQVAATDLNSDGREWMEVAGRKFSSTNPPRMCRTGPES